MDYMTSILYLPELVRTQDDADDIWQANFTGPSCNVLESYAREVARFRMYTRTPASKTRSVSITKPNFAVRFCGEDVKSVRPSILYT